MVVSCDLKTNKERVVITCGFLARTGALILGQGPTLLGTIRINQKSDPALKQLTAEDKQQHVQGTNENRLVTMQGWQWSQDRAPNHHWIFVGIIKTS